MWPLVFLIQRLHDNPTNQNAEPFAFGQASHLQSIAARGQKLVLSLTRLQGRLVGLGQALCMTASPEPAMQDVIPIASGRQNGRAHAGLPNWF